jgi:hypothetical protein
MTAAGIELAERLHGEVRRALAPTTDRLGARERRALTRRLETMLCSTARSAGIRSPYRG